MRGSPLEWTSSVSLQRKPLHEKYFIGGCSCGENLVGAVFLLMCVNVHGKELLEFMKSGSALIVCVLLPVPLQCPSGHFHCTNGKCVPGSEKCDNEDDCGDNSDEYPSRTAHCRKYCSKQK